MHQYNVGALFEKIAIDVAGSFPRSDQGDRYLLIAMDYFTKWPEALSRGFDSGGRLPTSSVFSEYRGSLLY
jgi:hypothetical protein